MSAAPTNSALARVLTELIDGAGDEGIVLNPKDPGLLSSLDKLTPDEASETPGGGSSVAAHVDHLRYGLSLLNRWHRGEDPFSDADYRASWKRNKVTADEWAARRKELRAEVEAWRDALASSRKASDFEKAAVIGSVVHLAYHLGAIRQISAKVRGPSAAD